MQLKCDKNGIKTYRPRILVDKRSHSKLHARDEIQDEKNEIAKIEQENDSKDESNDNVESRHKKDIIVVSVTEDMLELLCSTGEEWTSLSLPIKNLLLFNKGYRVRKPREIKIGSLGVLIAGDAHIKDDHLALCLGDPEPCHDVGNVVKMSQGHDVDNVVGRNIWSIVVKLPSPPASRVARLVLIHDKVRAHSSFLSGAHDSYYRGPRDPGGRGGGVRGLQGRSLVLQQKTYKQNLLRRDHSHPSASVIVKRKYKFVFLL